MQGLTLYKSSAGSGKTFTLVLEYLKLVIVQPSVYRQVLAVTFTNKATDEMKNRIVDTLSDLSSADPAGLEKNAYYQQLQQHLKDLGKEQEISIQAHAAQTLNFILNDYSSFSVSTIESFFQRIVRAFAKELNIPLGYDIEMKQDRVLEQLVAGLMLDVGQHQHLNRLFEGFVRRNLDEERSWHVDREVGNLGSQIFQERFQRLMVEHEPDEELISRTLSFAKTLQKIRAIYESGLREKAGEIIQMIEDAGLTAHDFSGKGRSPAQYFYKVQNGIQLFPTDAQRRAVTLPEKWVGKTSPRKADLEALLAQGFLERYQDMLDMLDRNRPSYESAAAILKHLFSFGLIQELNQRLSEYRREHQQMIISDTGFLLSNVVQDAYDAPFIYEKVGTRFQYYLIDEFQDTSDMQWENLFPLVREVMANGWGSLLVGDVKQSIYRWRNGNMRLLMRGVEDQVQSMGIEAQVEHLKNNWRTAEGVVEFNNTFFPVATQLLQAHGKEHEQVELNLAYEEVAQTPQQRKHQGLVSISFFATDKEAEEGHWKRQAEAKLLETLIELEALGYEYGDVTLLVRTNQEGVDLAEMLQQKKIRVSSAESLLIDRHPSVQFLLHALAFLNHEEDDIIHGALSVDAWKSGERAEALDHHRLAQRSVADQLPALAEEQQRLRQLSVYECLERLLQMFPSIAEPNPYVQGLLDAALEYVSSTDASLSGFLNWWEEVKGKRSVAAPKDRQAVEIMTIHKAKGLEFPVVILPYADWDMKPSQRGFLWVHSEESPYDAWPFLPVNPTKALLESHFSEAYEEEVFLTLLDNLNMLYVALTRPQYRLYLFSQARGGSSSKRKKTPEVGSQPDSIAKLLRLTLTEMMGEPVGEAPQQLRWGHAEEVRPIRKASETGGTSVMLHHNGEVRTHWNEAIRVKFYGKDLDARDLVHRSERQTAGQALHEALARVRYPKDIPQAVQQGVLLGEIPAAIAKEVEEELRQALANPSVESWFQESWEIKNEAELIQPNGMALRPDRVMVKDTHAVVVDYKSGATHSGHQHQVREYMRALQQMGYESVEGYVFYFLRGEVRKVSQN